MYPREGDCELMWCENCGAMTIHCYSDGDWWCTACFQGA